MIPIPENFKNAFSDSTHQLVKENRNENLYYQQLEKEYFELFHKIQEQLGEKHKELIMKFESTQNEMKSIDEDLIYLQGMIDCVALLRVIELI